MRDVAKRSTLMTPENWRAYLFIIVLMAKRARAEQRGQGGRGGRGPTPLAEELGRYFFFRWYLFVVFSMPPPGGGGGSEQSDRARPERKRRV